MERLATAAAILTLHAIVFGSAQDPGAKPRTADVLAGTWLPDPARCEEYWNPKDTNGLQRLSPQPGRKIPILTIAVRGKRISAETSVDGVAIASFVYTIDQDFVSLPLADGAVQSIDSHCTPGGLVNHVVTERDGALLIRGGELWAPSDDGNELTVTTTKEGMGSKSKSITVYLRRP